MGSFAYLYADGCKNGNGQWVNYTLGGQAPLYSCGQYQVRNLIRERIGVDSWARLTAWRESGTATAITGVWSPDYLDNGTGTPLN